MRTRRFTTFGAAAAAAVLFLSLAGSAGAEFAPPPPGPVLECVRECVGLRRDCARACNASFLDCMSGARLEMRMCRAGCVEQFGEDTPELETCLATCRDEIVIPAREECGALRRECAPQCQPGPCLLLCRPDGGGIGEDDECRGACARDLRSCAGEGKAALWECLSPCRSLTDEAEREACATTCVEAARAGAAACKEGFETCASACEVPTTTTTLAEP